MQFRRRSNSEFLKKTTKKRFVIIIEKALFKSVSFFFNHIKNIKALERNVYLKGFILVLISGWIFIFYQKEASHNIFQVYLVNVVQMFLTMYVQNTEFNITVVYVFLY